MFTSKSLFQSNIVFLADAKKFVSPENEAFMSLYRGVEASGARFIDDPIAKTRILTLPAISLKITLEDRRIRVEDLSMKEPDKSSLVTNALLIAQKLFGENTPLEGFGFNFDCYYKYTHVIPIEELFKSYFSETVLDDKTLLDFGFQFTLNNDRSKTKDVYFMKVTAPIELAMHMNRHFPTAHLPTEDSLKDLFINCYNDMDEPLKEF